MISSILFRQKVSRRRRVCEFERRADASLRLLWAKRQRFLARRPLKNKLVMASLCAPSAIVLMMLIVQ